MADKIPHRHAVPVFCTQPAPKRMAWEESLSELRSFPPIRVHENSTLESEPQHSQHRRQETSQDEENIPPSTQPRRPMNSSNSVNTTVPRGSEVRTITAVQHSYKVGHLHFFQWSTLLTFKHQRVRSESPIDDDDEGDTVPSAKRQCVSNESGVNLLEGVVRIAGSIDRMAAEAREDRQEFNDTLKKLLRELQRKL